MSFWLFPPQHLTFWVIQQVLSKRNSMDVIVVNGMFLQSCRIKHIWARFVIDSILLIDTFFVLFRSFRGRYTGLIVPEDLFWKRVFQTAFLCQIVVQSLGKLFWECPCSFALRFGKHMQVAYTRTGVEFAWLTDAGWHPWLWVCWERVPSKRQGQWDCQQY